MRLKTIKVRNFRRFSDLTVDRIPETARLIVLVGPNGCGKSSFFDALAEWNFFHGREEFNWDVGYHRKVGSVQPDQWTGQEVEIECHSSSISAYSRKDAFYFRSAYRNDADFQIRSLERMGRLVDAVNIRRMIESDAAVSRNYKRMAARTLLDLYGMEKDEITIREYREQQFGRVQTALHTLFPDLHLEGLGDPLKDGTFLFTKGESRGFQFKNLSGGEKASFDLILDLTIALQEYKDTVFCIDEPDSHMNMRLQAKLLDTLYKLIPVDCQLMIATHSVGMIRQARDIEEKTPGAVVFLDFGDRDFDHRQNIYPIKPDRRFWKNVYEVAFDDLSSLIAPSRIVICEGLPRGLKSVSNEAHDARCYERIFGDDFPDTQFVSMGNDRDVISDRLELATTLRIIFNEAKLKVVRLIDRDNRSEMEISDLVKRDVKVLKRRNLESYLFDDEVLRSLAISVGHSELADTILERKRGIVANTGNAAPDDLKPASGAVYVECKKILRLTRCGNTRESFMRDTLAPLVDKNMEVYKELKDIIFED